MRTGTRLAVDVGSVRVGVARCDPHGLIATPLVTLARISGRNPNRSAKAAKAPDDLDELVALTREHEPLEVLVGLPTGLSARPGKAAAAATAYAIRLGARIAPTPVRLVDERFSTVTATHNLRAAGRTVRSGRAVIDQAAAVVILQGALDQERATGSPPGTVVTAFSPAATSNSGTNNTSGTINGERSGHQGPTDAKADE